MILFSACLPEVPTPTPIPPTETATITPTTTATIIWFPATATYTAMPTQEASATPDLRPVLGSSLFKDPFIDQTLWQTFRSSTGSVAYGKGELTAAVAQPSGTLISLRKGPMLDNFYLEMDAQPSLCRAGDSYGLLLRANSPQDFYRLMLNCNGQIRLERYKNSRTAPLQDWMTSGQILPGGMMRIHLGVWATGPELRVFANNVFQFSVKDTAFESGTIGVFARSVGDTPVTVSFSNLMVYSSYGAPPRPINPTPPTRTPYPTATHRPAGVIKP